MPFISKDWRSPGEQWVKIGPGWERAKVLNYLHSSYFGNGDGSGGRGDESLQPQYNVTTRTTREIRRQNTLSEALLQLDFYSACHDIRRFNYTCRMLQLLLLSMDHLPGNVQRILIRLIDEAATTARQNGWCGQVRAVLQAMREKTVDQPVWGGQLGSTKLWEEHKAHITKILNSDSQSNIGSDSGKDDVDKSPPLDQLPEEVLRQILLKLSCEKDIESLGSSHACLGRVAGENRVWRELVAYHFTPQQLQLIQDRLESLPIWPNHRAGPLKAPLVVTEPLWKLKFKTLKRRYGLGREEYADELNLCKSCGLLFWTNQTSHDCGVPLLVRVKPGEFISLFCV
ncbi:F-box only protein 25 [Folsomia candida]|uniref:F-box only protein 25 n=1 Tax=Folsomia candida TaxID=158441 RepID=A0A226E4Z4_FOLCA|nr:F-box only protein 25 [Folsomia candida]XP_021956256.1 F-box only protein 25 [Folsomia candida]OXA52380.1 F-box only protein 25 [Folsomia candida]